MVRARTGRMGTLAQDGPPWGGSVYKEVMGQEGHEEEEQL